MEIGPTPHLAAPPLPILINYVKTFFFVTFVIFMIKKRTKEFKSN